LIEDEDFLPDIFEITFQTFFNEVLQLILETKFLKLEPPQSLSLAEMLLHSGGLTLATLDSLMCTVKLLIEAGSPIQAGGRSFTASPQSRRPTITTMYFL